MRKAFGCGILLLCLAGAGILVSCAKSQIAKDIEKAQKLWGNERVCLPCHIYQQPIARRHNYRCDTCHLGNPWSEDKEEGHFEMIGSPQKPEHLAATCDRCHRRVLGRDIPYDAEFIKDVLVSHKMVKGETLEWQE